MRATRFCVSVLVLCSAALWSSVALGLAVGDKPPELSGKNGKGEKVDLTDFKGKIVVVDFWATWCGPCMAEAPHMVQINKTYSADGLQILGVSLDTDRQNMMDVAKQSGFEWPQIFGGQNWDSPQAKSWGIHSIPCTFIIGPEGTVLWTGHPGNGIDEAIKKAFKEHPPQLVDPKVVAEATAALEKVSSAVQSKDYTAAMKLLGKVPAGAAKDKGVADKLAEVQKEMSAFADSMLAEVEPLITAKQYPAAVSKLRDLSLKLAGTPSGNKARERLSALAGDPEVRKQIDAADRADKAEAALAIAQKLQGEKKDAIAYARYKEIVTMFAGTPAATNAATAIADYEKDPVFVKNVIGAQNEAKAKAALGMADSYKSAGNTAKARKKYQEVIAQYPGTPQAATAKKTLSELPAD